MLNLLKFFKKPHKWGTTVWDRNYMFTLPISHCQYIFLRDTLFYIPICVRMFSSEWSWFFFSSWDFKDHICKRLLSYHSDIILIWDSKNSLDCFRWVSPEKTSSHIKNKNSYCLGLRWRLMETLNREIIPLPFYVQSKTPFTLPSPHRVISCWLSRTRWKWLSL